MEGILLDSPWVSQEHVHPVNQTCQHVNMNHMLCGVSCFFKTWMLKSYWKMYSWRIITTSTKIILRGESAPLTTVRILMLAADCYLLNKPSINSDKSQIHQSYLLPATKRWDLAMWDAIPGPEGKWPTAQLVPASPAPTISMACRESSSPGTLTSLHSTVQQHSNTPAQYIFAWASELFP